MKNLITITESLLLIAIMMIIILCNTNHDIQCDKVVPVNDTSSINQTLKNMKKPTSKDKDSIIQRMVDKPHNAYIPPKTQSTIDRIIERTTTKKPNHEILYSEC